MSKLLLAKSQHKENPIKVFDTGYYLEIELHGVHVAMDTEHLENGRTLSIARCKFFDEHLGVSPTGNRRESANALHTVVEGLLNKLSIAKELHSYLKRKKFSFSESGLASLEAYRKPVRLVVTGLLTIENPRSLI